MFNKFISNKKLLSKCAITGSIILGGSYLLIEKYNPILWAYCYNNKKKNVGSIMANLVSNENDKEFSRIFNRINRSIEEYDDMPEFLKKIIDPICKEDFRENIFYCMRIAIAKNNLKTMEMIKNSNLNISSQDIMKDSYLCSPHQLLKEATDENLNFILTYYKDILYRNDDYYNFINFDRKDRIFSIGINKFGKDLIENIILGFIKNESVNQNDIDKLLDSLDKKSEQYIIRNLVTNSYRYMKCTDAKYNDTLNKLIEKNKDITMNVGYESIINLSKKNMNHILDQIMKNKNYSNEEKNEILFNAYFNNMTKNNGTCDSKDENTNIVVNYLKKQCHYDENIVGPSEIKKCTKNYKNEIVCQTLEEYYQDYINENSDYDYYSGYGSFGGFGCGCNSPSSFCKLI